MNETAPTNFSTGLELIEILKSKYSERTPHIGSKFRFPSALIFFSSQKEYYTFLEQAPWGFHRLSDIIGPDQSLSAYKLNKWFNEALEKSKQKPLVLVPITEFIRFHPDNQNSLIISKFFNQLVQSEKSKIIIPMLDFYSNYQHFVKGFTHKERMAEVFSQSEIEDNTKEDLEIIFDNLGVISSNNLDKINNIKDWVLLWETGNIAFKSKIIIQNEKISNVIQKIDISVPKIKKVIFNNFKDYIEYEFNIPRASFTIEPPKEIQDCILSKILKMKGLKNWETIERTELGDEKQFESQFYVFWDQSQHDEKRISRWFWLNKAKKIKFSNTALNEAIEKAIDPEKVLDQLYVNGLRNQNIDYSILVQRRNILTKFSNPHFTSDNATFEGIFEEMRKSLGDDPAQAIERIVGHFAFERIALIEFIPHLMRSQSGLSANHFIIVKEVWPEFAEYIEPGLAPESIRSFTIIDEFSVFAKIYLSHYILSKVAYDRPTDDLESLQTEFRKQWKEINAGKITGKIQTHDNGILPSEIRDKKYIFLDGVGFEWNKVIQYLFEKCGWQVLDSIPIFAPLPSTTEFFPLEIMMEGRSTEQYDDFDKMIHESYEYPFSIEREIVKLTEIVERKIHQKYKGYQQPMWIISDHGSTAFARKGKPLTSFKDEDKKHGGRYGKLTQSSFLETDGQKLINRDKKFIISMTYDNLGKTCPRGEAHGGGTPEEILAFAIKVAPPSVKQQLIPSIIVKSKKAECSPLDEEIVLFIEGTFQEQIIDIKLSINKSQAFSVDMQYYKQRVLNLPMSCLNQHGIKVGENELQFVFNGVIHSSCDIKLTSASEKTDFDKKFGF